MRRSTARRRIPLVTLVVPILLLILSASASAQQVIRISNYKARPGMDEQISKLTDEEITGEYAGMKGLKWVKFYLDPSTGERGSVTLWADRASLDLYMNSAARRGILAKLQPLIEGEVTSKIYVVYERKK